MSLDEEIKGLAGRAKDGSHGLAVATTARKNAVLRRAAAQIRGPLMGRLVEANALDVKRSTELRLSAAMMDRLRLGEERLAKLADAVEHIATLDDPVGSTTGFRVLDNGLSAAQMRIPLGLIGIVYESRPGVTADAAALCIKSGNGVLLRGGKEAFETNQVLAGIFQDALEAEGLPREAVSFIPTTDREATNMMLRLSGVLDLLIPRGGESLIRFVTEHATVPVIQHYKGVCHVYVDGAADLDKGAAIALNSKVHRTGVCNAMETLLVDRVVAEAFVPRVVTAFQREQVEVRGDDTVQSLAQGVVPATGEDWDTEYLDRIVSVAVVDGLDGALDHVRRHGSFHTESIVTEDYGRAQRWLRTVDASMVLVNASTRFNDGSEMGLGAEMGISTTKMHAYGPMGLLELCALKWVVYGEGQVRV